jgi:hypothetical protein
MSSLEYDKQMYEAKPKNIRKEVIKKNKEQYRT